MPLQRGVLASVSTLLYLFLHETEYYDGIEQLAFSRSVLLLLAKCGGIPRKNFSLGSDQDNRHANCHLWQLAWRLS